MTQYTQLNTLAHFHTTTLPHKKICRKVANVKKKYYLCSDFVKNT